MRLSKSIKPVSYVKTHVSEIIRKLGEPASDPVIITQNGEAKAVLQSIEQYEQMQESLAMLKILALSTKDVEEGRVAPLDDVLQRLREKVQDK